MRALPLGIALVLLGFSLRRALFVVAAVLPPRRRVGASGETPRVVLVVAARNESVGLRPTLEALERLDFPPDRLVVIAVNDGSRDDTGRMLREWAQRSAGRLVVDLAESVGKYRAIDLAVAAALPSDLLAVCDADLRPRPDWLSRLVEPFADPRVGGVAAFIRPSNATATPIARYAAVESWVHQLVTSAGKDRLGLNPPTFGSSAYRRSAFEQVGGFATQGAGGDVRITMALIRAGWLTRFAPEAIADNTVVERWQDYWHQHIRWARNLFAAAGPRSVRPSAVSCGIGQRVELFLLTTGYLDRLVFLAALALALPGWLSFWWPAGYLTILALEVAVALWKVGLAHDAMAFFAATIAMFAVDIVGSIAAGLGHVLARPRAWRNPREVAPRVGTQS